MDTFDGTANLSYGYTNSFIGVPIKGFTAIARISSYYST